MTLMVLQNKFARQLNLVHTAIHWTLDISHQAFKHLRQKIQTVQEMQREKSISLFSLMSEVYGLTV